MFKWEAQEFQKDPLKIEPGVHEEQKNYKCDICHLNFNNLQNFKIHTHSKYQLNIYNEKFEKSIGLSRSGPRPKCHWCQYCGMEFKIKRQLDRHLKSHHECCFCYQTFNRSEYLKNHKAFAHTRNDPYGRKIDNLKCYECNSYFSTQEKVKNHVDTTHNPERF